MLRIPSLVLTHFIRMQFRFICFRVARFIFSKMVIEQCFTTSGIATSLQVWSSKVLCKVLSSNGKTQSTPYSTHNPRIRSLQRSTLRSIQNPVRAFHRRKIEIHIRKPLPLNASNHRNLSVQLKKKLFWLTHTSLRSWCTVGQRAKGQQHYHRSQQKVSSVIQLDHSFYKVQGETDNLKVLAFVETTTSMPGAVIVPDLSANPVAIKALKQFIAINGFTKSAIKCNGHSGLLRLRRQVGREMSLPTQVSPPYNHQNPGTVEWFHKTWYGQVKAIRIGLADHLEIHSDQIDGSLFPWIAQHSAYQINRYLIRSDGRISYKKLFNKPQQSPVVHFGERVLAHIQSQPPTQKL